MSHKSVALVVRMKVIRESSFGQLRLGEAVHIEITYVMTLVPQNPHQFGLQISYVKTAGSACTVVNRTVHYGDLQIRILLGKRRHQRQCAVIEGLIVCGGKMGIVMGIVGSQHNQSKIELGSIFHCGVILRSVLVSCTQIVSHGLSAAAVVDHHVILPQNSLENRRIGAIVPIGGKISFGDTVTNAGNGGQIAFAALGKSVGKIDLALSRTHTLSDVIQDIIPRMIGRCPRIAGFQIAGKRSVHISAAQYQLIGSDRVLIFVHIHRIISVTLSAVGRTYKDFILSFFGAGIQCDFQHHPGNVVQIRLHTLGDQLIEVVFGGKISSCPMILTAGVYDLVVCNIGTRNFQSGFQRCFLILHTILFTAFGTARGLIRRAGDEDCQQSNDNQKKKQRNPFHPIDSFPISFCAALLPFSSITAAIWNYTSCLFLRATTAARAKMETIATTAAAIAASPVGGTGTVPGALSATLSVTS